jgi:hypothetical protein
MKKIAIGLYQKKWSFSTKGNLSFGWPGKQLINLAFNAQTSGQVEFQLIEQLGEVVISQTLVNGQNFAQYSTGNLTSGIYYWRLKDVERTIRTDKIAIMK